MKIIHKSTEQIPKDENVWQMKTKCGIFVSDYMCSFRWKKVTCPKCVKLSGEELSKPTEEKDG